jgi:hypothetical protein
MFSGSYRLPLAATGIHNPERSGCPSAVLVMGALRSGSPSAVRGIPGVDKLNHCALNWELSSKKILNVTSCFNIGFL